MSPLISVLWLAAAPPPPNLQVIARLAAPASTSTVTSVDLEQHARAAAVWFMDVRLLGKARAQRIDDAVRACRSDDRCVAGRLREAGLAWGLYVTADLTSQPNLLTVEVLDVARDEIRSADVVPLGGPEVIEASARRVLAAAGLRPLGVVRVKVTPDSADVAISPPEGEAARLSGTEARRPAGPIRITASRAGFETHTSTATLPAFETLAIDLELAPEESVWTTWWLWTAIGLGAAAIAGGTVAAIAVSRGDAMDPPTCHGPGC